MTDSAFSDPARVRSKRARTYSMVDSLAQVRKYKLALEGERLAYASFIGTSDWEDYANLSFTAMQAEALADIDMRLEALSAAVVHIDGHLARIVELLELQSGVGPQPPTVGAARLVEETLGRASRYERQQKERGELAEAERERVQPQREQRALDRQDRQGQGDPLLELLNDPDIAEQARNVRRIYGSDVCVSFLKRQAAELGIGELDLSEEDLPDAF